MIQRAINSKTPIISECTDCKTDLEVNYIKEHLLKTNHLNYELKLRNKDEISTDFHSMGDSLNKYIQIKIHHLLIEKEYDKIIVKGKYDRWATISNSEKTDKRFNWKRPTARVNGNNIHILCFPGQDYVIHYGLIVFYYFYINKLKIPKITLNIPSEELCNETLVNETNIKSLPKQDVVIMGYIDKLVGDFPDWEGEGDFRWKRFYIYNQRVALLGCRFSYWADISGRVLKYLANQGTKLVIYMGKLGSLDESHIPNQHLATGEESLVDGDLIKWKNPFEDNNSNFIKEGKHITLPSILMETKDWVDQSKDYSFVDPEIGFMAKASLEEDVGFGFLHIISDNLKKEFKEDLSNEREKSVLNKRELIINEIRKALNRVFKNGRN